MVSDWGAIKDRVEALSAGLDLEMPSGGDDSTAAVVRAVREGRLDREVVRTAVRRLELLAGPAPDGEVLVDHPAHHLLARRAAGQSAVLLRNERQALPLLPGTRVAVLGRFALDPQYQGGGSSHVNATRVDLPLDELRSALGADAVDYADGYAKGKDLDEGLLTEATELAARADVAVVFAGLYEAEQSEGFDRTDLELPAAHVALIQRVAAVAPRTVVVLMNGGVVSLEPWHDSVDAIVEGWALGQASGSALADVLTGAVNPSGRLAETIPLDLRDTPSALTFPGMSGTARHGEGVFVGYRHYTTIGRQVRYPFGHGLSYTRFTYCEPRVLETSTDHMRVAVDVSNVGARGGAEVVQVYVSCPEAGERRPARTLAAFQKVFLDAGQSRTVEMDIDRRALAWWDVRHDGWRVEGGTYRVMFGHSVEDIETCVETELAGDPVFVPPLTLESSVKQWFAHPVVGPLLMEGMLAEAGPEQRAAAEEGMNMLRMIDSMPMGQFAQMPMVGIRDETLEELMAVSREPQSQD